MHRGGMGHMAVCEGEEDAPSPPSPPPLRARGLCRIVGAVKMLDPLGSSSAVHGTSHGGYTIHAIYCVTLSSNLRHLRRR